MHDGLHALFDDITHALTSKHENYQLLYIILWKASLPAKMSCYDWLRNIFAGRLFSIMDHGPKRVILQSNVNKRCKANSKMQKITKQKTINECESKEKHSENSLTVKTIQFETIYF